MNRSALCSVLGFILSRAKLCYGFYNASRTNTALIYDAKLEPINSRPFDEILASHWIIKSWCSKNISPLLGGGCLQHHSSFELIDSKFDNLVLFNRIDAVYGPRNCVSWKLKSISDIALVLSWSLHVRDNWCSSKLPSCFSGDHICCDRTCWSTDKLRLRFIDHKNSSNISTHWVLLCID